MDLESRGGGRESVRTEGRGNCGWDAPCERRFYFQLKQKRVL